MQCSSIIAQGTACCQHSVEQHICEAGQQGQPAPCSTACQGSRDKHFMRLALQQAITAAGLQVWACVQLMLIHLMTVGGE